jgi:hypothetical protein
MILEADCGEHSQFFTYWQSARWCGASLPEGMRLYTLSLRITGRPNSALVLRFTKTLTNKIDGFIFQFRRKPQRYP